METAQYCPYCNHRVNERWESLSKGLVKTLSIFSDAVIRKNTNTIHLQKDLTLSNNQYNNFQKLRYFGLVAKVKDGNYSSGRWLLTKRGSDFIYHNEFIPRKVKVVNNHKVEQSDEFINIAGVVKKEPYWHKVEDYTQDSFV